MCAPCKVILNNIGCAVATGRSLHEAVNDAVGQVLDELSEETQNELSKLDVKYTRKRMADDTDYYDSVVSILSKQAGVNLG